MNKKFILTGWLVCVFQMAFGQTQLIINGGFETGSIFPWSFSGAGQSVLNNAPSAHSGSYFLSMGNINAATQTVSQTFTVPSNAVAAVLSYSWAVTSSDNSQVDQFEVLLATNVSPQLVDLQSNFSQRGLYFQKNFDMTPYIGKTAQLFFVVTSDATFGSMTHFFIDDVSVLWATSAELPATDYFTNRAVLTGLSVTNLANNTFATKEPGEPNHAGNTGGRSLWWTWTAPADGTVTLNTAGSSFVTLLGVYTGSVVSNLTKVVSDSGSNHKGGAAQLNFSAVAGTEYQIAVDGFNGTLGNIVLKLNFKPDLTPPVVSISAPESKAKFTNSTITVRGKASDNVRVGRVEFRLENAGGTNEYAIATGTNSWSAIVTDLLPGLNTVRVRAIDTSSNVSKTVTRSFSYVPVSPLTVNIVGNGGVSPSLNGKLLALGQSYSVTAKPMSPAFVFDGWTGDVTFGLANLTFVMQSNLVLQANFVANPFAPVVGNYQGLILGTNGPSLPRSGFFTVKVTKSGSFSAKVVLAGKSSSFSGVFLGSGVYSNSIARKKLSPLFVELQLDLAGADQISGFISDDVGTSGLLANRAVFSKTNQTPLAGNYTLNILGTNATSTGTNYTPLLPGGDGIGTVKVDASGNITFAGTLADGTKISQQTFVSKDGIWPMYAPLYSGQGVVSGTLLLSNQVPTDIAGALNWIKLAIPAAKLFPAGFEYETFVLGSRYTNAVLNFTNGIVVFDNGNLTESFFNQVIIGAKSKVTDVSLTNKLAMKFTSTSGLFSGKVTPPGAAKAISFSGAFLQKQGYGFGFFVDTNRSGGVFFGPIPGP